MLLLLALALAAGGAAGGAAEARTAIGVFEGWGAFRVAAPRRCYAIAAPIRAGASARWRPFASVSSRFGRDRRNALFVRLSSATSPAATITLGIGERRFVLSGSGSAAWAPDAKTDRAIVAAMRGARSMSIAAVSLRGAPFADVYALGGAATAIDAAALGCVAR